MSSVSARPHPGRGEPVLVGCSVGLFECVGDRFVAWHLLALGEQLGRRLIAERGVYGRQRVFVQAGPVGLSGLAGLLGDVVGRTEETCCPARVVVCVCHGSESEENLTCCDRSGGREKRQGLTQMLGGSLDVSATEEREAEVRQDATSCVRKAQLSRDGERLGERPGGSVEFSLGHEYIREIVERERERPAIAARTRQRYCLLVHALRLIEMAVSQGGPTEQRPCAGACDGVVELGR